MPHSFFTDLSDRSSLSLSLSDHENFIMLSLNFTGHIHSIKTWIDLRKFGRTNLRLRCLKYEFRTFSCSLVKCLAVCLNVLEIIFHYKGVLKGSLAFLEKKANGKYFQKVLEASNRT